MLKWTSRSTLGSQDSLRNNLQQDQSLDRCKISKEDQRNCTMESCDPVENRRYSIGSVPRDESKRETTTASRIGFSGRGSNPVWHQTSGLPFSYTNPVGNHRLEYPFLKRVDPREDESDANTKDTKSVKTLTEQLESIADSSPITVAEREKTLVPPRTRSRSMSRLFSPSRKSEDATTSKTGIFSKVKKIFQRSKSVSRSSTPKSVRKCQDFPESPNRRKRKGSQDSPASTRLTRRIEAKRYERKKTGIVSQSLISELKNEIEAAKYQYPELGLDFLSPNNSEDEKGGVQKEPTFTFETFKQSTSLSCHTRIKDIFPRSSDDGNDSPDKSASFNIRTPVKGSDCNDDGIGTNTKSQFGESNSTKFGEQGDRSRQNFTAIYHSDNGYIPNVELSKENSLLKTKSDGEISFRGKSLLKPRSSFSKVSLSHVPNMTYSQCDEGSFRKEWREKLERSDSMKSLLRYGESLVEMLEFQKSLSDGLTKHEFLQKTNNVIEKTDRSFNVKKESDLTEGILPDDEEFLKCCSATTHTTESIQSVERVEKGSRISPHFTSMVKRGDCLAATSEANLENNRDVVREVNDVSPINVSNELPSWDATDSTGDSVVQSLGSVETNNDVGRLADTKCYLRLSPGNDTSTTLSTKNNLEVKDVDHSKSSIDPRQKTKNNNNGHGVFCKTKLFLDDNVTIDAPIAGEKKHSLFESQATVFTECTVGMAWSDVCNKPQKFIATSPIRVKNIVSHLEEQIKKKERQSEAQKAMAYCESQEKATKGFLTPVIDPVRFQATPMTFSKVVRNSVEDGLKINNPDEYNPFALYASEVCQSDKAGVGLGDLHTCSDSFKVELEDQSMLSSLSDVVVYSGGSDVVRGSSSCDTQSLLSEMVESSPLDGLRSPGTDPNNEISLCDDACEGENVSTREQNLLNASIPHKDESQISQTSNRSGISRGEKIENFKNSQSDLAEPQLMSGASDDVFACKGITDVTPPQHLVKSSTKDSLSDNSLAFIDHLDEEYCVSVASNITKADKSPKRYETGNVNPIPTSGSSGNAKPRLGSILSPVSKLPSPVKKTVSFKLDTTTSPSSSISSQSNDAAICETLPQLPKDPSEGSTGASQQEKSASMDDCPVTSHKSSNSPTKTAQFSSPSAEDISWWVDEEMDFVGKPEPERDFVGLKVEEVGPVVSELDDKERNAHDDQERRPNYFGTDKSETETKPTLTSEKSLDTKLFDIPISTQGRFSSETPNVIKTIWGESNGSQGTFAREEHIDNNVTWHESSESRSKALTYVVHDQLYTAPSKPANVNSPASDDSIDALLVDADASSALSELAEQFESPTRSISLRSPVTYGVLAEDAKKSIFTYKGEPKAKDTPFWERQNLKRPVTRCTPLQSKHSPFLSDSANKTSKGETKQHAKKRNESLNLGSVSSKLKDRGFRKRTFRYRLMKSNSKAGEGPSHSSETPKPTADNVKSDGEKFEKLKSEQVGSFKTSKTNIKASPLRACEMTELLPTTDPTSNSRSPPQKEKMPVRQLSPHASPASRREQKSGSASDPKAFNGKRKISPMSHNRSSSGEKNLKSPSKNQKSEDDKGGITLENKMHQSKRNNEKQSSKRNIDTEKLSVPTETLTDKTTQTSNLPVKKKINVLGSSQLRNEMRSNFPQVKTNNKEPIESPRTEVCESIVNKGRCGSISGKWDADKILLPDQRQNSSDNTLILDSVTPLSPQTNKNDVVIDSSPSIKPSKENVDVDKLIEKSTSSSSGYKKWKSTRSQYSTSSDLESFDEYAESLSSREKLRHRICPRNRQLQSRNVSPRHARSGSFHGCEQLYRRGPPHKNVTEPSYTDISCRSYRQRVARLPESAKDLNYVCMGCKSHYNKRSCHNPKANQATVTPDHTAKDSVTDSKPGEWFFIATFFMFQILLHWLHAASK